MKYRPEFPARFGCIEDAKALLPKLLRLVQQDHHQAGLGLMTPNRSITAKPMPSTARQVTLDRAFTANPERFVQRHHNHPPRPTAVWINPPQKE